MIDWFYLHVINTNWFLLFGVSLPSIFGLYIIYKLIKLSLDQSDNNQNNEDTQSNQEENQGENQGDGSPASQES